VVAAGEVKLNDTLPSTNAPSAPSMGQRPGAPASGAKPGEIANRGEPPHGVMPWNTG
jgi:hypothetical protein